MSLDSFSSALEKFFKDKLLKFSLIFSLLLNLLLWFYLAWQIRKLPSVIPLHYNIYYGIDFLGPWYYLIFLAGLGLGLIIINFFIALAVLTNHKILSYFSILSLGVIQFLLFAACVAIININI